MNIIIVLKWRDDDNAIYNRNKKSEEIVINIYKKLFIESSNHIINFCKLLYFFDFQIL